MKSKGLRKLAIAIGDQPPAEFRIFVAGINETEHGQFLFDEQAAEQVMAAYRAHGVDTMIDLEHQSLDPDSKNYDPDARGWCRLELRNGELWAVGVSWTTDGSERLSEKRQRYVSPAFLTNPETKRVEKILNIAITAMPATHMTPALVAASMKRLAMADAPATPEPADPTGADNTPDLDQILSAHQLGDSSTIAKWLGLTGDATPQDIFAAMDAVVDKIGPMYGFTDDDSGMQTDTIVDKSGKQVGEGGIKSAAGVGADEYKAMRASLLRETNAPTPLQALATIALWKSSHLRLEAAETKLAADRAKMERADRHALAARLVKVGAETPHTSGLASNKLAKHLAEMPLVELRERVEHFEKLGGVGAGKPAAQAPATGSATHTAPADVSQLSARELRTCEEMNVKPEVYARNKAQLEARRAAASAR